MVSQAQIDEAARLIREGELVAFPTETVYGLGANALNPEAVAKIFIEKERPSFDPLIVHICKIEDLALLCEKMDERVLALAAKFWPGPLTIVLPRSNLVPDIVSSGLPTVAIRMPNNEIALKLIAAAQCPIAAPSANKFGKLSPTKAQHVRKQFPLLPCILDGGATSVGIESTVIAIEDDGFKILRPGVITRQEIETVLPYSTSPVKNDPFFASPGLLNSHYSPNKPLYIEGDYQPMADTTNAGYISFTGMGGEGYKRVEYLSHTGNLSEAATNLFRTLHSLEESDVTFIVAEPIPLQGIGVAIMDRLKKAAYRFTKNESSPDKEP
ncbi:L-threonylcarbamoyladenylate synthase [Williamwhitmania taraxaci]|uniref:Threonylcarbamoyl-AMP synthase n=1 Tax=Williamwhitmania taraxaci TaxID=1640674 RepID=A0A1G6KCN7_9BACT|nr:L-threonylcarbamoyladenylate synthase [Williamwhitmania taraxaci]SDC28842.1 L-threonylcarbamoyladenylate synthase [Williamwhitmania taraxaci]